MAEKLTIQPLTKEAFAPFGSVIETDPAAMRYINGGTTERYNALAVADAVGEDAKVIINIFRGSPRSFPYAIGMMERHPFGSQSFSPIDNRPWLVVVAADEGGKPATAVSPGRAPAAATRLLRRSRPPRRPGRSPPTRVVEHESTRLEPLGPNGGRGRRRR